MITVRPIGSCGPITDCTVCESRDISNLTVEFWESSSVDVAFLQLGGGCLICVPDYCDESTAYALPLDLNCPGRPDEQFNCTDEDLFETVLCAPKHDNYVYAPPCGPYGTRGQWIQEAFCCPREVA